MIESGGNADWLGVVVQGIGYLMVLVALAVLASRWGGKWQARLLGGGGPIQLLAGRNLAPGVGLRLVQVGRRGWLIGVTRERVSLLAELTAEEMEALELSRPAGS